MSHPQGGFREGDSWKSCDKPRMGQVVNGRIEVNIKQLTRAESQEKIDREYALGQIDLDHWLWVTEMLSGVTEAED